MHLTYGRGGGQPPWEDDPQYRPQGYGQQFPQKQPWQPQQYDPYARQRGTDAQQTPYPPPSEPSQPAGND